MKKGYIIIMCLIGLLYAGTGFGQKNDEGQVYKNAVGVKFYPGALTIKHNFNNLIGAEGITYLYSGNSVRVTGLLEFNFNIEKVSGLRWFVGPGAHVSFAKHRAQATTFVGVDAIVGLDYKFAGIPLNVSVDWQPSFEFGEDPKYNGVTDRLQYGPGFTGGWAGAAIRFTF